LLEEGAPLSASVQRLKEKWESEYEQWKSTAMRREISGLFFWDRG
jgi:hypothetical protein